MPRSPSQSRRLPLTALVVSTTLSALVAREETKSLDGHFKDSVSHSGNRGLVTSWREGNLSIMPGGGPPSTSRYLWAVLPPPPGGWDLSTFASLEAEFSYRGDSPAKLLLWVVGDRGWDAVPSAATLAPGETRTLSCNLREAYPDRTPKIDPRHIKEIRVMLTGRRADRAVFELRSLSGLGEAPAWTIPPGRLEVPPVEDGEPAPGKRVRHRLPGDEGTGLYSILHLPEDWETGRSYPVIAEYPGNVFFTEGCYSTGLPEQCVIGHGISKGRGSICVGLPFVDPEARAVAEHGWGDPDTTADYAVRFMERICTDFGGDRARIVLTGFSRGAIACGFIGLRNERIAPLWMGFHACQHYDGDGWNGATLEGALERAKRFRGKAVFQTDNSPAAFAPVMEAMNTEVVWAKSGLDAHATAMFLDDRESTLRLREWYRALVAE